MANVDAALEQQILDVPQRQREANVHDGHQPDHLRRPVEVAKRAGVRVRTSVRPTLPPLTFDALGLAVPAETHAISLFEASVFPQPAGCHHGVQAGQRRR